MTDTFIDELPILVTMPRARKAGLAIFGGQRQLVIERVIAAGSFSSWLCGDKLVTVAVDPDVGGRIAVQMLGDPLQMHCVAGITALRVATDAAEAGEQTRLHARIRAEAIRAMRET